MRIKICRQEAKESRYWLRLIEVGGEEAEKRMQSLINEATELMKIFGSIVEESAEKVLPVIATPICRGKQSPFEIAELVPSVSEESRSEFASSFLKKDAQPLALLAKTMRFSAVSEKTK